VTNYYIEQNNEVVLIDTDRNRLIETLSFMPQYQSLEIKETEDNIYYPKTLEELKAEKVAELQTLDLGQGIKLPLSYKVNAQGLKEVFEINPSIETFIPDVDGHLMPINKATFDSLYPVFILKAFEAESKIFAVQKASTIAELEAI